MMRVAVRLWCHPRATGRGMFQQLPTSDLYLVEEKVDSERFREELKGGA
jgi:hypothetical protein